MALLVTPVLSRADRLFATGLRAEAFAELRRLSVAQYGSLLLHVPPRYQALKAALPVMPSDDVQRSWTGNHGRVLLRQTCAFVRSLETAFRRFCARPLLGATILDYGCGWGRIMRLMYRFSDPQDVYGLDPWDASIAVCRETRVLGHLARSEYMPDELPFAGVEFDLVYAFSVFTHLSQSAASTALRAIRRRIRTDGLLVVTVRPPDYWYVSREVPPASIEPLRRRHFDEGFAFLPFAMEPVGGEVLYGDASIAVDYMRRNWTEWRLEGCETNARDPYQVVAFLRPG
jgi:SAM-dependent methyltransferase